MSNKIDNITLIDDATIIKALIANVGVIRNTAKTLRCKPEDLYYRLKNNPTLRATAKEQVDARLNLMVDKALLVIDEALDRKNIKVAMMVLQRGGVFQEWLQKEKDPGDYPQDNKPQSVDPATNQWQEKLENSPKDKKGRVIVGGEDKQKH